jgi:hypothetical protein
MRYKMVEYKRCLVCKEFVLSEMDWMIHINGHREDLDIIKEEIDYKYGLIEEMDKEGY